MPDQAVRDPSKDCYRYDLLAMRGMRRIARTCQEGAVKYGDNNCRKGGPHMSLPSLLNHAISHLFAYTEALNTGQEPEEDDLAHAAWNLMMAMHFEEEAEHFPVGVTGEPEYVLVAFREAVG